MKADKPLGQRNYGSIPHLPNSRMGPSDSSITEGQARICTEQARDKHDTIIVQEKLDGSNVGVAKIDGQILALGRAGYLAQTSPFEQHQLFASWVRENESRFSYVLRDGERIAGEWLAQAHGTRYELWHEPFVAFDLLTGPERATWKELVARVKGLFAMPHLVSLGEPIKVEVALEILGEYGKHGAIDPIEGVVYRVERNKLKDRHSGERHQVVDFLAKWVRPDKVDGSYLESVSGNPPVWNWRPA